MSGWANGAPLCRAAEPVLPGESRGPSLESIASICGSGVVREAYGPYTRRSSETATRRPVPHVSEDAQASVEVGAADGGTHEKLQCVAFLVRAQPMKAERSR